MNISTYLTINDTRKQHKKELGKPHNKWNEHHNLGVLIMDFRTTSISIREKFNFDSKTLEKFCKNFSKDPEIAEFVVISTCNRVEIYYLSNDLIDAEFKLCEYLSVFFKQHIVTICDSFEPQYNLSAMAHLFRLAGGLESMVIGDTGILGQIKSQFQQCQKAGVTGAYLNKLFNGVIHAGKRVRHETGISRGLQSMSSVAITKLLHIYEDDLNKQKVLMIGCGEANIGAFRRLIAIGHPHLFISNRTESVALEMKKMYAPLEIVPFSMVKSVLPEYDIIILGLSVPEPFLANQDLQGVTNKQITVVDLGVPRNTHSDIVNNPNARLVTIDDLQTEATKISSERVKEVTYVSEVLWEEEQEYFRWCYERTKSHPKEYHKHHHDEKTESHKEHKDEFHREHKDAA